MFDGKVEYLAYNCFRPTSKGSHAFSKHPHTEIFQFAESAVKVLAKNCPAAIVDGLIRVDIFQRNDGKFVVNEFESFEADFNPSGSHRDNLKCKLISNMERYYKLLLRKYIDPIYFE